MYRLYGPGPEGKTCGECENCIRYSPTDRHYWKCRLYGISGGGSTDWRQKWPACGMFDRESGEIPVIEQLKHAPRAVLMRTECDGQTSMF
jgi:hypothetical protein